MTEGAMMIPCPICDHKSRHVDGLFAHLYNHHRKSELICFLTKGSLFTRGYEKLMKNELVKKVVEKAHRIMTHGKLQEKIEALATIEYIEKPDKGVVPKGKMVQKHKVLQVVEEAKKEFPYFPRNLPANADAPDIVRCYDAYRRYRREVWNWKKKWFGE